MTDTTYAFGDRVTFTRSLNRRSEDPARWPKYTHIRGTAKIWTPERWCGDDNTNPPVEPREGIIIGKRTLANGVITWGTYEDPDIFRPVEHFTAYVIAYDMRRNPVYVLPEYITPTTTQENTDDE